MSLFNKPNYDLNMLRTTSKDALKRTALMMCEGDIKKASEIYDYFIKDVDSMPDFDTPPTPFIEQAKNTVGEVFGFLDENKDKLMGAWEFIKSMRGGGSAPAAPSQPLPPLM